MLPSNSKLQTFLLGNSLKNSEVPLVILFDSIYAAKLIGMDYETSNSSPENIAKKLIKSHEIHPADDIGLSLSSKAITVPLGAQEKFFDNGPSSITAHPLDSLKKWGQLDFSQVVAEKNSQVDKIFKSAKILRERFGSSFPIRVTLSAPFTTVANILGMKEFFISLRKEKEKSHQALADITKVLLSIVKKFIEIENLYFHISDPIATGAMIGPNLYKEFPLRYTKELVDFVHGNNRPTILHICGDTSLTLELMADTGADGLSLDQVMNMEDAKNRVGNRVTLIGNINPIEILQNASPEEVKESVKKEMEKVKESPKGFIIAPGCDITYATPPANILAMVDAVKNI